MLSRRLPNSIKTRSPSEEDPQEITRRADSQVYDKETKNDKLNYYYDDIIQGLQDDRDAQDALLRKERSEGNFGL